MKRSTSIHDKVAVALESGTRDATSCPVRLGRLFVKIPCGFCTPCIPHLIHLISEHKVIAPFRLDDVVRRLPIAMLSASLSLTEDADFLSSFITKQGLIQCVKFSKLVTLRINAQANSNTEPRDVTDHEMRVDHECNLTPSWHLCVHPRTITESNVSTSMDVTPVIDLDNDNCS